ncbi:MAG: hypothetical protein ACFFCP_18640, partial [Promethearchaeota archaeon]
MKSRYRLPLLMLLAFMIVFNVLVAVEPQTTRNVNLQDRNTSLQNRNLSPLLSPNQLYTNAAQGWTMWSDVSSGLPVQEYGNRTDIFANNQMRYFATNSSTSSTSVSVPMDPNWEGHKLFVDISDLTENRTWVQDPDMENSPSSWSLNSVSIGGGAAPSAYWLSDGHGVGDDCVEFEIADGGDPSVGERAWAQQTFTVDRGDVVWAGFRMDYWVATASTWGADGFVAIFVSIETTDYTQRVWQKSFPDVDQNATWYDSGLISLPDLSLFDLSDGVLVTVGLYSQQTVNY